MHNTIMDNSINCMTKAVIFFVALLAIYVQMLQCQLKQKRKHQKKTPTKQNCSEKIEQECDSDYNEQCEFTFAKKKKPVHTQVNEHCSQKNQPNSNKAIPSCEKSQFNQNQQSCFPQQQLLKRFNILRSNSLNLNFIEEEISSSSLPIEEEHISQKEPRKQMELPTNLNQQGFRVARSSNHYQENCKTSKIIRLSTLSDLDIQKKGNLAKKAQSTKRKMKLGKIRIFGKEVERVEEDVDEQIIRKVKLIEKPQKINITDFNKSLSSSLEDQIKTITRKKTFIEKTFPLASVVKEDEINKSLETNLSRTDIQQKEEKKDIAQKINEDIGQQSVLSKRKSKQDIEKEIKQDFKNYKYKALIVEPKTPSQENIISEHEEVQSLFTIEQTNKEANQNLKDPIELFSKIDTKGLEFLNILKRDKLKIKPKYSSINVRRISQKKENDLVRSNTMGLKKLHGILKKAVEESENDFFQGMSQQQYQIQETTIRNDSKQVFQDIQPEFLLTTIPNNLNESQQQSQNNILQMPEPDAATHNFGAIEQTQSGSGGFEFGRVDSVKLMMMMDPSSLFKNPNSPQHPNRHLFEQQDNSMHQELNTAFVLDESTQQQPNLNQSGNSLHQLFPDQINLEQQSNLFSNFNQKPSEQIIDISTKNKDQKNDKILKSEEEQEQGQGGSGILKK